MGFVSQLQLVITATNIDQNAHLKLGRLFVAFPIV